MNLFQLVLKQMRQRSLSTWLTLLSVLLGVALADSIMLLRREGRGLFGQSDYGFEVVVGAKGSKLELILNSVYHMEQSPGNVPYSLYEKMTEGDPRDNALRRDVAIAVPTAVGDNYKGYRVVGTTPGMFGIDDEGKPLPPDKAFEYRLGKSFQFASGQSFAPDKYQAVIGSEVAKRTGLKPGDRFQVEHGLQQTPNPDVHPQHWRVVGVLKPTHTANDRVVFIPLLSFYSITEHTSGLMDINALRRGESLPSQSPHPTPSTAASTAHDASSHDAAHAHAPHAPHAGHAAHDHDHDHAAADSEDVTLVLPKSDWMLSAILVHTRGGYQAQDLMWQINNGTQATAANPASEMREFFDQFLDANFAVLFYIALLVTVVAAVSILVSIYNSVSARKREIAILRALGATRRRVLALICIEAGIVGLVGAVLGLLVGHLVLGSLASAYLEATIGQGINWWTVGAEEWLYLLLVIIIAILAGLVPALKAYRTPVATNLVAG